MDWQFRAPQSDYFDYPRYWKLPSLTETLPLKSCIKCPKKDIFDRKSFYNRQTLNDRKYFYIMSQKKVSVRQHFLSEKKNSVIKTFHHRNKFLSNFCQRNSFPSEKHISVTQKKVSFVDIFWLHTKFLSGKKMMSQKSFDRKFLLGT